MSHKPANDQNDVDWNRQCSLEKCPDVFVKAFLQFSVETKLENYRKF